MESHSVFAAAFSLMKEKPAFDISGSAREELLENDLRNLNLCRLRQSTLTSSPNPEQKIPWTRCYHYHHRMGNEGQSAFIALYEVS